MSTTTASSFLNAAGTMGRVTISERIEAARRERRVLTRVSRAAWSSRHPARETRVIREAVFRVLASDDVNPETIGVAARAAMFVDDPNRD